LYIFIGRLNLLVIKTLQTSMTILTSPSFLQSILPPNWRAFQAHSRTQALYTYILSPEGRRFSTVEAVNTYLTELIKEKEMQEIMENTDMFKRKKTEEREKGAARRKKNMSDRNPLRNILKRTLKKNYLKKKCMTKQLKIRKRRK
jgi:hypothetical protein